MKKYLHYLYQLSPFGFAYGIHKNLNTLTKKINIYFFFFPSKRKEFINEINFLNNGAKVAHQYSFVFPYPFALDYDMNNINVFKDTNNGLFYVIHNGKKLYYSRDFKNETEVKKTYNNISIEQDERSPHRYLNQTFNIDEGDVVVDIGAAEGNFSLDVVEKISTLYIFEPDTNWIEALNATFEPWKEKVHIINKYVSDNENDNCTTLDNVFGDRIPVNFIKIDVEGEEIKILECSKKVINNNSSLKMAICTYHRKNDAKTIEKTLLKHNFNCSFTNGYMLFMSKRLTPPYFRRGIIRAEKD